MLSFRGNENFGIWNEKIARASCGLQEKMTLRLLNRLSRQKEVFSKRNDRVSVYVCGITPYDITHLGHAFTYTHFDVLVRYLRHLGCGVSYVQNLTDVDDDILAKAQNSGRNWRELGEKNADSFLQDMHWIGNAQPDVYPRASDVIPEIIDLTHILLGKDMAYESGGSVYFKADIKDIFGSLSGLPADRWLPVANERGNHPDDPNKRDPLDFVLWQAAERGEPFWPSPWGQGRPGWHVECSVMAMKYLGQTIDINGGGSDLAFPHHECCIAQSEGATGQTFARYWLHTGMIRHEGQKMSKSLGNMVFVNDLKSMGSNPVRICLLSHHYGKTWSFDRHETDQAEQTAALFRHVWRHPSGQGPVVDPRPYEQRFYDAMDDDLDTPRALSIMKEMAQNIISDSSRNVSDAKGLLSVACNVLGLEYRYGT
jgi:L-cysteine:1D-myo-inositol 2-amino-2-deoxy-alpha-D-glucopyranoside ligase